MVGGEWDVLFYRTRMGESPVREYKDGTVEAENLETLNQFVDERRENSQGFRDAYDSTRGAFELRARLIEARLRKGLTQRQLAEKMGTTQSVVSRIEQGRFKHRVETLHQLAAVLGIRFEITADDLRVSRNEKEASAERRTSESIPPKTVGAVRR